MQTLPQLDLTFHAPRNYSTTGIVKGQLVIIYVASCKQQGCNHSTRHLNRAGRSRLVWAHRREQILQERQNFFGRLNTHTEVEVALELKKMADCATHDFIDWVSAVDEVLMDMADVDHEDLPDANWQSWYLAGMSAKISADRAMDQANNY